MKRKASMIKLMRKPAVKWFPKVSLLRETEPRKLEFTGKIFGFTLRWMAWMILVDW